VQWLLLYKINSSNYIVAKLTSAAAIKCSRKACITPNFKPHTNSYELRESHDVLWSTIFKSISI